VYDRDNNDEFILISSDGIWDQHFSEVDKEIVQNDYEEAIKVIGNQLKSNVSPKNILEELLDSKLSADTGAGFGLDNMAAILVIF